MSLFRKRSYWPKALLIHDFIDLIVGIFSTWNNVLRIASVANGIGELVIDTARTVFSLNLSKPKDCVFD